MPGWSRKTLDKVDSRSTAQADSFAGAKEGKKRRLASLGMTGSLFFLSLVMCGTAIFVFVSLSLAARIRSVAMAFYGCEVPLV